MQLLSDEVWQQLDPGAGRLDAGERRRLVVVLVSIAAVLALGFGVWSSGLLYPRIVARDSDGTGWRAGGGHRFSVAVVLANEGRTARHLSVGRSGEGLELVRVEGLDGGVLKPSGVATVVLSYRVTDCAAVQTGDWPVPVTVENFGGHTSVMVEPNPDLVEALSLARDGTSAEPLGSWQQTLARTACLPADPLTG